MNASSDPGDRAPKGAVGAVTTRRANGVPNDPMKTCVPLFVKSACG